MSKFCGNCGTELEDEAKVCGKCGTFLDGTPDKIKGMKIDNSKKQKKGRKRVRMFVALAVLAIFAISAFWIVSNFTGSNGLLRKVMKAYESYDIDTLILLSGNMYVYGEKEDLRYYFEDSVGSDLDFFETSVGHKYKFSYEINEIYELSERRHSELINEIKKNYPGFNTKNINKAVIADLTVTAEQGKESASRYIKITMTKENDEWKLLYIE